ncbi:MAG: AtpZ/AtpI family protein [Acidimicrobiia bacterium]|jgi:F0F1-type ATP synthase assembly protein I
MTNGEDQSGGSHLVPDRAEVTGAFSPGVDFISSVVAGLLLGLGLDWWLNTRPVFVVIGVVAGFISGFLKLWRYSALMEQQAKERTRGY